MRGVLTVSALVLAASLSLPAHAAKKYEAWEGTWHLNKKETVYPKGVMVTDNDLVVHKDDGDKLVYTEPVVANGKNDVQKYDGAYDGKYYDWQIPAAKRRKKNYYVPGFERLYSYC